MKIKILNATYKVDSNRGINFLEKPKLLEKLNSIIDWDKSIFPPNLDETPTEQEVRLSQEGETRGCAIAILEAKAMGMSEDDIDSKLIPQLEEKTGKTITKTADGWYTMLASVYPENREYLGNPPQLKPGNVFELDGQLIAVGINPKTKEEILVLYNTETGGLALDRIWKEMIDVEYTLQTIPEDAFLELDIRGTDIIPIDQFIFFSEGMDRLDDLFDEDNPNNEDFLSNPFNKKKLPPQYWRYVLRTYPMLKEQLENGILQITCVPNFEELNFYIDKRGTLIYDSSDLEESEFEIIYSCFWNGFWSYLKSIPELNVNIPTLQECKDEARRKGEEDLNPGDTVTQINVAKGVVVNIPQGGTVIGKTSSGGTIIGV